MSETVKPASSASSETGERILGAALELFAQRGYEGTSIREIALKACVSKANIFHHYASKSGLYEAVLERASARFRQQHELLRERPLPEAIEAFTRGHLHQMLEEPAMIHLFLRQLLSDTAQPQRASAENTVSRGVEDLVGILEERLRDGRAEPGRDAVGLALMLLGSSFAYFQLRHVIERRREGLLQELGADDYCRRLSKLLAPALVADENPPAENIGSR